MLFWNLKGSSYTADFSFKELLREVASPLAR